MANYFYTDANGTKRGPITNQQLKALASQGVIQPTTMVETESGKQGVAGKIAGLTFGEPVGPKYTPVPPPTPKQLYCTNCGNATSDQAVACMACGAKPIGHKKFCRQCGVALNPEQVVCVKCGASVAAPIMPDAKRVVESVTSSFSPVIGKIKDALTSVPVLGIAATFGVGLVMLIALFWMGSGMFGGGNPLKQAKRGDWCRYDVTMAEDGRRILNGKHLTEVTSNDGKTVTLRHTMSSERGQNKTKIEDIDLSKSADDLELQQLKQLMRQMAEDIGITIDEGSIKIQNDKKYTNETITVANKKFDCIIMASTVTMTGSDGATITIACRNWASKAAPTVTGRLVKSEQKITITTKQDTKKCELTMELAAFGSSSVL
ncbi:MAG: double zinc ribbon domain-containing protein [Thermoguttaceae bacterium]